MCIRDRYYTIRVLVVRTPVSSLSFQVQHTWYLVRHMQAPNRLYKSKVRGSVSRVKSPCEQGLPHCTYVLRAEQRLPHATEEKAKRRFPMERGPTAKHHPAWNPQCTQWFRQRSFRSSALHRTSCHASVPVMLEKRGGRCRTDGPIRVLSCQMRHTIAAIKSCGVALCVKPPLGVRSTLPALSLIHI